MRDYKTMQFSVDDITLFKDDESVDFALGEVWLLAEGNNSHKNPISLDVLKRDAHTMLGKFLIADYSQITGDVTTHTNNQQIIGYFPKDSQIEFKEKDDKIFAVFEVIISKLYATPVYLLFKENNFRNVSAEFSAKEGEMDNNGNVPILEICFHGCTILGLDYQPSCRGAEMSIKQFSTEDAENYYHFNKHFSELDKFVENRMKKFEKKALKVNKEILKYDDWGDIDKTKLRKRVVESSNASTIVKDVYALVESGWEQSPSEHLKYPIMQLNGNTLYYNRYALASALAYAKQNDENSVVNKIMKLYKKFDINEDGGEKDMAEKQFSAVQIGNIWSLVCTALRKKMDSYYDWNIIGMYEEDNQKFVIIQKYDETQLYRIDFDLTEDGLSLSDEWLKVVQDFVTKDTVKKYSEDGLNLYQSIRDYVNKEFNDKNFDIHQINENSVVLNFDKVNEDIEIPSCFTFGEKIEITMECDEFKKRFEDDDDIDDDDDNDSDDKDEGDDGSTKKMSLDINNYVGAMLSMLQAENMEQFIEAKDSVDFEAEDKDIIMSVIENVMTESFELKEFKKDILEKECKLEIQKTLSEVKSVLSSEKYAELEEMSKDYNYDNVKDFQIQAKAFAYENGIKPKSSKNSDIMKMGYDFSMFDNTKNNDSNVFEKILNKNN